MTEPASEDGVLVEQARRLVEGGAERRVTLRVLGALAVQQRCPRAWRIAVHSGRRTADVDLAGLRRQWANIIRTFEALGYEVDERRAMLHGQDRLIFFHPSGFRVDVFLDRLRMSHDLDLRHRLDIHPLTLSLADLLLQKLQIVELTAKDVVDLLVLLREHPVTEDESGINAAYVGELLRGDWGFYHTATRNLFHIRDEALEGSDALEEEDRSIIRERVDDLLTRIEAVPKTLGWKARARMGTRVRWYRDVEDLQR